MKSENMNFEKIFAQFIKTLAEQEDVNIEFELSRKEVEGEEDAAS